jgi:pimeloyl-ACP methyl ester carboxylesterase
MGGTIASMYAGVRTERLQWLVNMEGYGMPQLAADELPALVAGWLDALHRPPAPRRYEELEELAAAVQRANPFLPVPNARFLAQVWTRPADGGYEMRSDPRHQMRSPVRYGRAEVEACWARVRAPQLLLYGEQSGQARRTLKKDTPEDLRAISPSLSLTPIPEAGHLLPYEQPRRVAQAIVKFVAERAG